MPYSRAPLGAGKRPPATRLGASLIAHPHLDQVKEVADLFSSFGVATYLSIFFGAPRRIGGLPTSDPLDPAVRQWRADIATDIYRTIPQFGGFLVKADSEGEPGPYQYGRTHADGANMLAEALAPYGGTVIWRAFVYNSKQDWRDRTTDRAKATSSIAGIAVGFMLDKVGFQSSAEAQTASVQMAIANILLFGVCSLSLVALVIALRFALNKKTHKVLIDEVQRLCEGGDPESVKPEVRRTVESLTGVAYNKLHKSIPEDQVQQDFEDATHADANSSSASKPQQFFSDPDMVTA